ncbi:MAG: hypothetical protein K2M12_09195 [Muribaculaceae bacterium]|nr:hypothetical protein [Muribaculaceae bacterium]
MNSITKKIMMAAIMAITVLSASAQGFPIAPQPESTVHGTAADSPSKQELLSRLRRWVALSFDRSDVVDLIDPEAGTVVLKWSAPLQQPSEWLAPALSETCVIDVRYGGAWRMQIYSPRISWSIPETVGMLDEMGLASGEATADSKLVAGLSQRVYSGNMSWPVDEKLDEVVAAYREQLQNTQQFRNDRDRERGRSTDEYRAAERQWRILSETKRSAAALDATLVQSLSRALATPLDF